MTNLTNKLAEDETVIDVLADLMRKGIDFNIHTCEATRQIIQRYEEHKKKHKAGVKHTYDKVTDHWYNLMTKEQKLGMPYPKYAAEMYGDYPSKAESDYARKAQYVADAMSGRKRMYGYDPAKSDDMVDAFRYAMGADSGLEGLIKKKFSLWERIKFYFKPKKYKWKY